MTPALAYMLKVGLGLASFYILYALFLQTETHFHLNRLILVGGLLLSFLIPAFPVVSPFRTVASPALSGPWMLPAGPERAIGALDILFLAYAAGVLLFLFRFAGHLIRLGGVIRRRGVRRLHGLKIVAVEQKFSPFSFLGLVFVNEGLADEGNLSRILAHERVHIRQLHSLDLLLMEIVLSLQWFNPFVWPYKKALQETHEYLADAGVIAQGFSSVRYQRLMFEQHVGARLFEFGSEFKQSQIKRRISMLGKIPSSPAAKLKALLALPLALVLVLVFAQPRAAASTVVTGGQEKVVVTEANRKEYVAQVQKEVVKISEMAAEIKMKIEATTDETAKKEWMLKLETLSRKRQELLAVLEASGGKLPPPPPEEMLKKLEMKEAEAKAALEKTSDPAEKAKIEEMLAKIAQKRAQIQDEAKSAGLHVAKSTPEALQKSLAELKAMDADIRAKLEKTEDPQKKAELEDMLKKIARKTDLVKAQIAEAKAGAKDVGIEKIVR